MIFYDWETMAKLAKGDPKNIIVMVARLTYNLTCHSSNRQKDIFYKSDISGDSYLLNPELLLKNENAASLRHMVEYIGLASYRRYADYQMTGDSSLSIHHCRMKIENIEKNPLLIVRNDKIHFKLEE